MISIALVALACVVGQAPAPASAVPPRLAQPIEVDGKRMAVPTPEQAAWQDLEVGMFIHLAPQTWQNSESDKLTISPGDMNPEKLDTDQWVRVAESMGAKYIVFVAKHEGGFCWWQTDTTDFSVKSTPWKGGKGDALADLSASCKARGMKLGVYLSPQDRKHGVGVGGKAKDPADQASYEKLLRTQLTEVLTKYGAMTEVWFDGNLAFDMGDILDAHARGAMIFQGPQATIRWVGNEQGVVPEDSWSTVRAGKQQWGHYKAVDGDPDGDRWLPNECDARIRATWFWRTDNQKTLKSVKQLVDMYEQSVGRGAVLLLNQTPDRSGLIPEADAARAAEFGKEIQRIYGPSGEIASTSGDGKELEVQPSTPAMIDRLVIMEDITKGERVREFEIDVLVGGKWVSVAHGTAIGHKRIVRLEPVMAGSVRLRVTKSVGEPIIKRLSLHLAGAEAEGAKPAPAPSPAAPAAPGK
jgi:alpha-L-fucosidase